MKLKNSAFALLALFATGAIAQNRPLEWYNENLPKEHVVRVIDETNINIEHGDDGQLKVQRWLNDERMLISSQAAGYAQEQIVFSSFFDVHDVEASTFIPRGNNKFRERKIKDFRTEKLMSDRVFHDDLQAIRFEFPYVQKGAKIAYSYTEDILNPFFIPPVYLQGSYFTEKIRITLNAPEDVKVKVNQFHVEEGYVKYSTSTKRGVVTHVWEVDSVPQFNGESGAPKPSYYVPHISFIIEGFEGENGPEKVLTGVADLYDWYSNMLDSVNYELTPEIEKTIDSLKSKSNSELELAQALFDHVRGSIKYIAVEDGLGGFIPDNPANVESKKFGDCKGMSCLLATMMRYAGLNARECWIGTRDIPYSYNENYTPFVDNHMITAYNYQDTWYFLDPTDEYVPFGFPSAFIQGKEALIGQGRDKFKLEQVPIMGPEYNAIKRHDTLRINELELLGNAHLELSGYVASRFKRNFKRTEDEDRFFKYYLESGNDKFQVEQKPEPNVKDTTVDLNYTFKIPDYLREFDGTYFINLNLDRLYAESTFEDRKLPLERDYLHSYDLQRVLEIPDGYALKSMPENFEYASDYAKIKLTYSKNENFITHHLQMDLTQLLLQPDFAEEWNEMVKQLRKVYRINIELTKSEK